MLKVASASCSTAHAAWIASATARPDWLPGTTVNDATVPMTGSAWLMTGAPVSVCPRTPGYLRWSLSSAAWSDLAYASLV